MVLGILAAMPAEIAKLKANVTNQSEQNFGNAFTYTTGSLCGKEVVFAAANVGMVFAASAVTTMINHFKVTAVIFTGVAGGLKVRAPLRESPAGVKPTSYLCLWRRTDRA